MPADPTAEFPTDHYDVIIIGSGAGGGTLAHRLAPTGKRVLLLECGDWLPREVENWDATAVFVDNRYVSADTWYDKEGKSFQPQIHYNVGGATKLYGAALYRLRERDFGELKHFDGISPAWPVSYDDFEPSYTQAEELYQVRGHGGEAQTEPRRSAPYRYPPVSNEPRIQQLYGDLVKVGLHPFHAPCGILLDEANPAYSKCIRCATCDGFPCMIHAKADAEVIAVRPALEYPNVTMLRNIHVIRLHTDDTGRTVTSVVAVVNGEQQRFHGDIVVVSAGAANSAKLLLNSANHLHPGGLANGSDQVGRNYLFHNSLAFLAVSIEKNPTKFQKRCPSTTSTSAMTTSSSPWAISRWSARARRRCTGARTRWKPCWPPPSPCPTSSCTPSTSGCPPKTCRCPRTASPSAQTATSC